MNTEDRQTINVKNSIDNLRMAVNEISSLEITYSKLAEVKQKRLRDAIYPVMKTFIKTSLWADEKVAKLLLDATKLEDEISIKHMEHIENRN